uniref:Reverse transcriptase zinc-binding domain-containing protein n=1 Tax=Sus scrofa TaxID=9823 RepID=A0A4X1WE20_PIG
MRHHLIPARMATIKKSTNNKCWRGCGEKGTLVHCWQECQMVQPLWKTVWRFLRNLKIELSFGPAIPLLGTYPEKTTTLKDTCTPMFIAALFAITWKQPKCPPTEEWIKKQCIYTMQYYSAIKRMK